MILILFGFFILLFPALVIFMCSRYTVVEKIGAGIICYGAGIALSVFGLVPEGAKPVQEGFMTITVPLSIPLMLFSTDLKRWSRLAGKTALSLVLMILSVLLVVGTGYFLFGGYLKDAWQIAGMAIGVYTGGTPNLNAIGLALKAPEHVIVLTNTSDMLACIPWFFFILTLAQKTLSRFLPPFQENIREDIGDDAMLETASRERMDINDYRGIFSRPVMVPLMGAVGLAVFIFAVGGGLYAVSPKEFNMAVLMLVITTLGLASSFVPRVRSIPMTFQLGQYIILVFCVAVGSMADIGQLVTAAPAIMLFIVFVVYGSWITHTLLCKIFSVDTDTAIITSVAALFSPPFVPVVASALKNKEIIISGLTAGIIGYAIGNYLGISFAYLLKSLGG